MDRICLYNGPRPTKLEAGEAVTFISGPNKGSIFIVQFPLNDSISNILFLIEELRTGRCLLVAAEQLERACHG